MSSPAIGVRDRGVTNSPLDRVDTSFFKSPRFRISVGVEVGCLGSFCFVEEVRRLS